MALTFVLASASTGRLGVLRAAGLDPVVMVSDVDESTVDSDDPVQLCAALARLKADAVADRVRGQSTHDAASTRALVLGCDSVLEFDGQIHGKPVDATQAVARWRQMRGRTGILHTGHCLIDTGGGTAEGVASTAVTFAEVTDDEIDAYVATGEPVRVAGAFTIDSLGGWFVERIEGDAGTVVGVSLPLLRRLLREVGVGVADLWSARLPSTR